MGGLPPTEEKEVSGGEDSFSNEKIRPDPYYVYDRYFHKKDDKDVRKDKGRRRSHVHMDLTLGLGNRCGVFDRTW
ncbi:Phytosulfokines 5 [Hordeum vulgare]|nr:Phytosulfokines 5 [Hordeum vulgare]